MPLGDPVKLLCTPKSFSLRFCGRYRGVSVLRFRGNRIQMEPKNLVTLFEKFPAQTIWDWWLKRNESTISQVQPMFQMSQNSAPATRLPVPCNSGNRARGRHCDGRAVGWVGCGL